MYIALRRASIGLLLALLAATLFPPATALAAAGLPSVRIEAQVAPDGSIVITEQRRIPAPQGAEFVEYLVPPAAVFELQSVADAAGPFQAGAAEGLNLQQYHLERQGQVIYLEWRPRPDPTEEVTIRYKLTGALIIHRDAVEWYWPALTGSGGRDFPLVEALIRLPAPALAYLYAYGGEAGGVHVERDTLQATATNLRADRPFEWRLLVDRSALPQAIGQPGPSDLATLRQAEEDRIAQAMNGATRRWLAHWLLLLAPLLAGGLYLATVRRHPPIPDPEQLSVQELTSAEPAAVGWVYDSDVLDIAVAQLLHLQRKGRVQWRFEHGGDHPTYEGDPLELAQAVTTGLSPADEALLAYFGLDTEPRTAEAIAQAWRTHPTEQRMREKTWLAAVAADVPREWLERPSPWPAGIIAALYLGMGMFAGGVVEWLLLWAAALLPILMIRKRRWLSALGEAHVARWVSLYGRACNRRRPALVDDGPSIPPEYLLAVGVGDAPLQHHLGDQRFEVVKAIYLHLDPNN